LIIGTAVVALIVILSPSTTVAGPEAEVKRLVVIFSGADRFDPFNVLLKVIEAVRAVLNTGPSLTIAVPVVVLAGTKTWASFASVGLLLVNV